MASNVISCELFKRTLLITGILVLYIAAQGAADSPGIGLLWHRDVRTTPSYNKHLIPCGRYICDTKFQYCTEVITGLSECFMCADQCHKSRVGNNDLYITNCMEICPEYWRRMTREKHITETTALPAPSAAAQTAHNGVVVFSGTLLTALAVFVTAVVGMLVGVLIVTRRKKWSKTHSDLSLQNNRIVMRHPNIADKMKRTPSVLTNPLMMMEDELTAPPVYNTRITLSDTHTSTTELAGSKRGISQSIMDAQTRIAHETIRDQPQTRIAHETISTDQAHTQQHSEVASGIPADSGTRIRTQDEQSETQQDMPHPGSQGNGDLAANIPQCTQDFYRNNLQSGIVEVPRVETSRYPTWPRAERTRDSGGQNAE